MRFFVQLFADVTIGSACVLVVSVVMSIESTCGRDAAVSVMAHIDDALFIYAAKHKGQYPENLDAIELYWRPGERIEDPWGRPFHYVRGRTVCGDGYWLVSLGSDGRWGGEGDARDRNNCREFEGEPWPVSVPRSSSSP